MMEHLTREEAIAVFMHSHPAIVGGSFWHRGERVMVPIEEGK